MSIGLGQNILDYYPAIYHYDYISMQLYTNTVNYSRYLTL